MNLFLTGWVEGYATILIDDNQVGKTDKRSTNTYKADINQNAFTKAQHNVDVLVENSGRGWSGPHMGMNGDVLLDGKIQSGYEIYPLEFKRDFVDKLKTVKGRALGGSKVPGLFRAELDITGTPKDTFFKIDGWTKGQLFVNGYNVGRYWNVGPQKTLYIPSHWLKTGKNDIYMFELHGHRDTIDLVDKPDLGPTH